MILARRIALVLLTPTVLTTLCYAQSTWYVDVNAAPGGSGTMTAPFDSIQGGITQATTLSGDTLLVADGQYLESIDYIGKNLIIRSQSGATTTSILAQTGSAVTASSGELSARLEGFTVSGGAGTLVGQESFGGGVYCNASALTVVDCDIRDNSAARGGGAYGGGLSSLTIHSTDIQMNTAELGGGVYAGECSLTIEDCLIKINLAKVSTGSSSPIGEGGGLWVGPASNVLVRDTQILSNSGLGPGFGFGPYGGGIYTSSPNALFENCGISSNGLGIQLGSGTRGAGVYCLGSAGALSVFRGCSISGNHARNGTGGGIFGVGVFIDCSVTNNRGIEGGGAAGSPQMTNCLIDGNTLFAVTGECVGRGGGVSGGTYRGCTISNNYAYRIGGGAFGATLIDCTIELNTTGGTCFMGTLEGGGGIADSVASGCLIRRNSATIGGEALNSEYGGGGAFDSTLTDCEVSGNIVISSPSTSYYTQSGVGGGTLNCDLTDCLIEGNSVDALFARGGRGGGVFGGSANGCTIRDNRASVGDGTKWQALGGGAADADLTRCLLSGNRADSGGGVWGGSIERCTIVNNSARFAGGAVSALPAAPGVVAGESIDVIDSILWDNGPNPIDTTGGVVTVAYSDVEGLFAGVGNIDLQPQFWSLESGDYQLRANSPCINAGNPMSPLDADGSIADMGAFPFDSNYSGGPYAFCDAKLNSAGCLPAIGSTGTPSLSGPDDFFVSATQMIEQSPTLAIWSMDSAATPFLGGTLCLAPMIRRTPVMNSGGATPCSGVGSFHFSQSYLASQGLASSDRVFVQFWQRDPAQLDGTGVGLSDALDFTVLP